MTDNSNAGTMTDIVRAIGGALNRGVYFLLSLMYQIFFNVASVQLFENETIKNFYGRVQLIIGVFMIFKLTISILQGIMDPDKFTNPKDGFGSIITRVIVALVMLTLIVPINIPNVENANSLEKYINNNGILFGALYSLQDRILTNNTLGRLILGTNDGTGDESTDQFETQNEKLVSSANVFATTILKGFFRINMLPEESRDSDDESLQSNWYCGNNLSDDNKKAIEAYTNLSTSTDTLLSDEMIYGDCEINDDILSTLANAASHIPVVGTFFENFGGESRYLFVFHWFPAIIVGIVFLVILVGFTVDIAIRSIKLSILRLLAPIPIISYIEPKSSKDGGMFSSWVSALTSTYLDLFLRLAIVYFVIFLVQDMIANGIIINEANGVIGFISCIFIWLGLFFFAKMAPKFIKDVLGLKGTMSNVGLSGVLGGAATLLGGGGLAGAGASMLSNMNAAAEAAGQGKAAPPAWQTGSDLAAQIKTGDPKAKGGLINSINDRLMREAGISRARKLYGVSANGVAMAKDNMYAAQGEASKLQDFYDRLTQGHLTAAEMDEVRAAGGLDANGNISEAYRNSKYNEMSKAQTRAAQAKSHYEEAKKFADSHRISPSFEEKYHRSLRERVGFGDNPRDREVYHAGHYDSKTGAYVRTSNRRDEHQTVSDKIFGRPSDWRDTTASDYREHVDNRWEPNKYSGDTNTMHDNPRGDIDTPTAGGPPPR